MKEYQKLQTAKEDDDDDNDYDDGDDKMMTMKMMMMTIMKRLAMTAESLTQFPLDHIECWAVGDECRLDHQVLGGRKSRMRVNALVTVYNF